MMVYILEIGMAQLDISAMAGVSRHIAALELYILKCLAQVSGHYFYMYSVCLGMKIAQFSGCSRGNCCCFDSR